MEFDFGETKASQAFFDRHTLYYDTFERLMMLGNRVFGRESPAKDLFEDVTFCLGHTCREDFIEIPVETWIYNLGPNKLMRSIRFEGGFVVDIDTLGYGYNK